ncbi:DUF969 domain-containing protein [Dokdonella sp.]|uniref:DUF969 domain-containing protein n=1 Tax=Dokdonella sp. TaxID=2291710 RepID=UPI0025C6BE4E|nr:DUF969 domain-containing protein [Dokdonella sp.]MBX3688152.1 DUF969 domain-containing protein [Dokdonella sp.]
MNYWPLLGVATVVIGFVLRVNPVLVVVIAGLVSGLAAGMSPGDLLAMLGSSFVSNRALLLMVMTLPVIGLLEHCGLRERARDWIAGFRGLTLTRFLASYLGLRQVLSMLGLTNVAGHAQTVRPLVAPMSEAAAERTVGTLERGQRHEVAAMAAATDNIGLFFGEDVFIALGAVLLIQGFFAQNDIELQPLAIALWALPTAIAAFLIHVLRLRHFQRQLERAARKRVDAKGEGAC